MRAYSNDLRERIVVAVERGDYPLRQLAHLFSVSLAFLVRLLQRKRRTGSVQPESHAGGPTPKLDDAARARLFDLVRQQAGGPTPKLDDAARARLFDLVRQQPDATLAELRERLGVSCSLMTIARALKRRCITRKKKTKHAGERDCPEVQAKRAAFEQRLATVDPAHLVFVDEMGANTALIRTYGRAPAGERVEAAAPGKWTNVTLIVGMRQTGVVAPLAFEGATDQLAFRTYVRDVLVPELQPGDVVVWDNLQPHKDAEAAPGDRGGGSDGGAATTVESRPDADRGDVLQDQRPSAVDCRPHDGNGHRRDGNRSGADYANGHRRLVPRSGRVCNALVNRSNAPRSPRVTGM